MNNPELFNSSVALTKEVHKILSASINQNLVLITENCWVKAEDGRFIRKEVSKPIWAIILNKLANELMATNEYSEFLKNLKSNCFVSSQLNNLVGTMLGGIRFDTFNFVSSFLKPFLTNEGLKPFDEIVFKAEYQKIENSLHAKEIEFERTTPICGFSTDISEIQLDNNLSIVKLTDSEIIELLNLGVRIGDNFGPNNVVFSENSFAIKFVFRLPKIIGESNEKHKVDQFRHILSKSQEQKVINSLRVFKQGKFFVQGSITKSRGLFNQGIRYNYGPQSESLLFDEFKILDEERDKFKEFFHGFSSAAVANKNYLAVAIRRFSQSIERPDLEDRIIDLLICAEAFFLSSGGT